MVKARIKNTSRPSVTANNDDNAACRANDLISRLPRLLYFGDVPVESSYHGSALLFRLLQRYPVEKLGIIESGTSVSKQERRLPGVNYTDFSLRGSRWLNTRFHRWVSAYYTLSASRRARSIALIDGFQANAVLTVAHGYGWLTAAQYAKQHELPLHLIIHDDRPRSATNSLISKYLEVTFGTIYRRAASRLCVSPFMCEEYRRRYASNGVVLYPSRASDCPNFFAPPERLGGNDQPFTVAFGGTINSAGYVRALTALASLLEKVRGKLLIFGPLTRRVAHKIGLARPNIVLRGILSSHELMQKFRDEADVLFVPMSFDSADRANMEISFPSKLTDYSAVGLPLLIYGPTYCSAVRWARENPRVAEVVDNENPTVLSEALRRLAASPAHRIALGTHALLVGRRYFTQEAAQAIFERALVSRDISY